MMTPLLPSDPKSIGPWELTHRLGAGGMGTVYLGRQGDRWAAVKVVSPGLADDPEFRARFRREIEVGRRVVGPSVAELYDADPDASQPWLAARYVPGQTLDRAVSQHGPLTGFALDRFASGTAEALSALHAKGVIHRDLKPSNVIITESAPVLIDFGIAAAADVTSLTATGIAIGSAGWMAPEQIVGRPVTPATDVFAWGALLVYASSGAAPYGIGRPESLAYRIVHGTPDLSGVSDRYRPIVAAAMAPEPNHRPTAPELLAALAGEPGETRLQEVVTATVADARASFESDTRVVSFRPDVAGEGERRGKMPMIIATAVAVIGLVVGGLLLWSRGDGSGGRADVAVAASETLTTTTSEVPTTTTEATTTTTSTTEATTTTTEPLPTTTEPPAPPPPELPRYEAVITPLSDDIHEFLGFAAAHDQEVVILDLRFDGDIGGGFLSVDPDYEPSLAHIFVCASASEDGYPAPCWDGAEMMIRDLDTVSDASLYWEHGSHRLRGRFAVQGVSGPHQGILGIGLRAVPIT